MADGKVVELFQALDLPHGGTFSNVVDHQKPITFESIKEAMVLVRRAQIRLVRNGK